jgi:hypothetical protein
MNQVGSKRKEELSLCGQSEWKSQSWPTKALDTLQLLVFWRWVESAPRKLGTSTGGVIVNSGEIQQMQFPQC